MAGFWRARGRGPARGPAATEDVPEHGCDDLECTECICVGRDKDDDASALGDDRLVRAVNLVDLDEHGSRREEGKRFSIALLVVPRSALFAAAERGREAGGWGQDGSGLGTKRAQTSEQARFRAKTRDRSAGLRRWTWGLPRGFWGARATFRTAVWSMKVTRGRDGGCWLHTMALVGGRARLWTSFRCSFARFPA